MNSECTNHGHLLALTSMLLHVSYHFPLRYSLEGYPHMGRARHEITGVISRPDVDCIPAGSGYG